MINFFELFQVEQNARVDQGILRKSYFNLQKKYHPDHNSNPSVDISIINIGYTTLSNVFLTILHILELNGKKISETTNDPDFLMHCMEWQERLLDQDDAMSVKKEILLEKNGMIEEIINQIDNKDFENAIKNAEKVAYLQKIASR